jgi:hypothetical protein
VLGSIAKNPLSTQKTQGKKCPKCADSAANEKEKSATVAKTKKKRRADAKKEVNVRTLPFSSTLIGKLKST